MREIKEKSTTFKFLMEKYLFFQKKRKKGSTGIAHCHATHLDGMSLTGVLKYLIKINLHVHSAEENFFKMLKSSNRTQLKKKRDGNILLCLLCSIMGRKSSVIAPDAEQLKDATLPLNGAGG